MKKILMILSLSLFIVAFSYCKKDSTDVPQLKSGITPNTVGNNFWHWKCHNPNCTGEGDCKCGDSMCRVTCDRCSNMLVADDWSKRMCGGIEK
jgi:hypothetical protein